jgi:predicted phage terminase large subunit-like protein
LTNFDEIKEPIRLGAKDHFWLFCLHYDYDFYVKRNFLKEVALLFQELYEQYNDGKAIKVSISMPPRAGKSYITSLFCAWWLGKFPQQAIMRNTVTSTLYRKFSYDIRNIVKEKKYQQVFPHVILAPDKQNIDGWSITLSKQGAYFGGGVGTNIIGFGANLAITDDLYSGFEQALSEVYNEGVHRWKQGSHNSRMEKNCPEIYIGTRWSKQDVIGKALEDGIIDKEITISALVDGQSFCEHVKSTEEYLKIKADTDDEIWEAEYQQTPIEVKGLLFPATELKFYNTSDINVKELAEHKALFIDPNAEGSDYFAGVLCYLIQDRIYITDVLCNKYDSATNMQSVIDLAVKNKVQYVAIESNGAFIILGQQIRNKINEVYEDCEIRLVKHTTNKETRILTQAAYIKNRFYFPKAESKEENDFIKNLTSYLREGKSKHDDCPDVTAFASHYFMKTFNI